MSPSKKPIIFISYSHEDEPETPAYGKVRWCTFVRSFLLPAELSGAVEIWVDTRMRGGADWEQEINRVLSCCDVFILLVSRHAMSSVHVNLELGIIRERLERGENVCLYPIMLTPTPKFALDKVRSSNLRPSGGKSFSSYSLNQRDRLMSQTADEIIEIAANVARGFAPPSLSTLIPSPCQSPPLPRC